MLDGRGGGGAEVTKWRRDCEMELVQLMVQEGGRIVSV